MPSTTLLQSLTGIRRRVKALGALYGLGLVILVGVGLVLGVVVLDYGLNLPAWPRLVMMLAGLGVLAAVVGRSLIGPVSAKLTLRDVAGKLEHAFPEFDDRLRSTVDFATEGQPGSEAMKLRTIAEAERIAGAVDLKKAISYRPTVEVLAVALVAVVMAVGMGLLAPNYTRIAWERLEHPFDANPWPKRVQIDLAGKIPSRVPVGERIDVKIRLVKGDSSSRRAVVYSQYGNGPVQQELMTRSSDGTYAASLDARPEEGSDAEMLKVWVKAGDDEKNLAPITVVPRLAIDRVEAVVTPPAYAGQAALTTNLSTGPAMAVEGSQVELRVVFNKAVKTAQSVRIEMVEADDPQTRHAKPNPKVQWALGQPMLAVGKLGADSSLRFHIKATDTDGFENVGLEEYELIVRPDQTPTVQIEVPRRNEERTAEATVPLQGVVEDDFGIQTAKLVVDRLVTSSDGKGGAGIGERPRHWEIPLIESGKPDGGVQWARADSAPDRLRFRANYDWVLGQLDKAQLKPGDVLEYYLAVTDNYSLNGQTHAAVPSGKLRISILSQEEFNNRITDELRLAAQQVGELKKTQARTKEETTTLKEDTKDKPKFDAGDQAVADRLVGQQSTVAAQSRQIASKMEDIRQRMDENKSQNNELRQTAKDVQDILTRAAEEPMKDALTRLSQARQEAQNPRNQDLDQTQASQQQSAEELQKALDRMGSVGNLQQVMDRIKDLLAKQQEVSKQTQEIAKNNLGKKPEEMSDADRAKLDKNAQDQQNLSDKTNKAIEDMDRMAEQLKKSDPTTSDAMKQASQTGQQQQVPQKQAKAAQSAKQNQQASAQSNQKQAELGLQMILNDLREAERRKLEELAAKLEELQQQIAHLIQRQANHNLDDLALQGPGRMGKVDPKVLADLTDKADRKNAPPNPPALPQLTAGQEQTERNSRDISKTTEELPNGAEPAALLTKAASKMERAIVFLRDSKLDPAFDPWQTEALRALADAKKIVDEQKQKVDQKRQDQQKEAIRQVYEKIKADQIVLDGETARLDHVPRNADGTLNRADAVRLGQLPGEQGKLADRTKALDDALGALGSVVYTWANKDIVNAMGQVKGDLAKPDTGRGTQGEQVRVVAQLDAMIKNLAIKPLEKKFEQRDSGGGGGNGTPPLPPEAELRLLKALQDGVNNGTKDAAAQPVKDKAAIVGLGSRQGELRNLLDQVFQKSTRGQVKLGPEPDNRDQLPEEAKKEDVENQELDQQLLGDNPTADETQKGVSLIGDRMARSRQRLALNTDPGPVTQEIQRRIDADLDTLIEMARKQQSQGSGQGKGQQQVVQKQEKPQEGKQSKPANGVSQPNRGQTPAQASTPPGPEDNTADLSQDIKEKMTEWGGVTKRQREAIIEGAGETVIQKYQKLIDDYSRALATKATEQRQ